MEIVYGNKEQNLIRLCRKGDEKAQYKLYRLYSKQMFNIAVRMTGETETAEDILQESFIRAFLEINQLKNENAFGGWLKRIVINRCIDEVRRKKGLFSLTENITEEHLKITEEVDDTTPAETVHYFIKKLPEGARQILVLHALEGFKHAEIGEQLGISESTVKTQYFRAKKLLGKMIKNWEYETGTGEIFREEQVDA